MTSQQLSRHDTMGSWTAPLCSAEHPISQALRACPPSAAPNTAYLSTLRTQQRPLLPQPRPNIPAAFSAAHRHPSPCLLYPSTSSGPQPTTPHAQWHVTRSHAHPSAPQRAQQVAAQLLLDRKREVEVAVLELAVRDRHARGAHGGVVAAHVGRRDDAVVRARHQVHGQPRARQPPVLVRDVGRRGGAVRDGVGGRRAVVKHLEAARARALRAVHHLAQRHRRHVRGRVVRHLQRAVPVADVVAQQRADGHRHDLRGAGQRAQVGDELEQQRAAQRGGDEEG
mmetsp:Transcript_19571/g.49765  ORF Transcript_19571/g.49765 Transcript_19571/m.49765 type:complete len:282 (+) Transcript_19571:1272-2117(+)